jgi:hypothetical protein
MITTDEVVVTATARRFPRRRRSGRRVRVGTLLLLWVGVGLASLTAQHAMAAWT